MALPKEPFSKAEVEEAIQGARTFWDAKERLTPHYYRAAYGYWLPFLLQAIRERDQEIERLRAERDALRGGHAMKAEEAEHYERAWRLQGIREGLEWAADVALELRHVEPFPKGIEATMRYSNMTCGVLAGIVRAGDPEQIAAEADKKGGNDDE